MAYDCIVHGATGLFWWGFGEGGHNEAFWEDMSKVVNELKSMTPVFVGRVAPPPKVSNSAIRLLRKTASGIDCLIAVNESGGEVSAEISGFPGNYVLFENRTVIGSDGKFTDFFEPYGVHVYSVNPTLPPPVELPVMKRCGPRINIDSDYRKGNWIWYPGRHRVVGDKEYFRRQFTPGKSVKKAELMVTGDDEFSWKLNGMPMPPKHSGHAWNIVEIFDITGDITSGENLLEITCCDRGTAPCGLYFVIRFTYLDGTKELIPADSGTIVSRDGKDNWVPAHVIGGYGVPPWHDMLPRFH